MQKIKRHTRIFTQKHYKKLIVAAALVAVAGAVVSWSNVFASPTLLVDPYENLSKTGTSMLRVSGAELLPNAQIEVHQRSSAPFSTAEGDEGTGTKVEQNMVAVINTDMDGNLSVEVPVTYDIEPTGSFNMAYCDTIAAEAKQCTLKFVYGDGNILAGNVILEQKLYFGMAGPVVTPPVTSPVTKEDCKGDKWKAYGSFGIKNQGDCVSYVASKQ